MDLEDKKITEQIIHCAFIVHKILGKGFLEKIYENAMLIELRKCNLNVEQQSPIRVDYNGEVIGHFYADLFVENKVICELKSTDNLALQHEIQLVNYLTATGIDTGLLINFSDRVTIKRKFRTYKKQH